ncbi:FixH family protein [Paenibacillus agaridevorans]|uniref:FixH family protein n=1 Tax=Paenibacillus agaridevorans TaxID=171404 RepID=UPI001BE4AB65|nr:FixH family protein [Paenibacillus agaridevorans]
MIDTYQWRRIGITMLLSASLSLGACTANEGMTDENGLRPHLNVDLQVPGTLKLHETSPFSVIVTQANKPVRADEILFQFWPEGSPDRLVTVAGLMRQEGVYTAEYGFIENGVYVVRSRVTAGSLEAMPAKRFAIGEEAVLRLAALEQQEAQGELASSDHGSGDHHH